MIIFNNIHVLSQRLIYFNHQEWVSECVWQGWNSNTNFLTNFHFWNNKETIDQSQVIILLVRDKDKQETEGPPAHYTAFDSLCSWRTPLSPSCMWIWEDWSKYQGLNGRSDVPWWGGTLGLRWGGSDLAIFTQVHRESVEPVCSPCQVGVIVFRRWSAIQIGNNVLPTAKPRWFTCTKAWIC